MGARRASKSSEEFGSMPLPTGDKGGDTSATGHARDAASRPRSGAAPGFYQEATAGTVTGKSLFRCGIGQGRRRFGRFSRRLEAGDLPLGDASVIAVTAVTF